MSDKGTTAESGLEETKLRQEIAKLKVETTNLEQTPRLEWLKAWGSILTPFATAVTILGTVYIGYLQISSKYASDEYQYWRDTIKVVDENTQRHEDLTYAIALLKPFLDSKRYHVFARNAAINLMSQLLDIEVFTDFFWVGISVDSVSRFSHDGGLGSPAVEGEEPSPGRGQNRCHGAKRSGVYTRVGGAMRPPNQYAIQI